MPVTVSPSGPDDRPVTVLPVDAQSMRATVEQALTQGPVPKYTDLEDMEGRLRKHLEVLLPETETYASPELIQVVRSHLDDGMGDGLMSARIHVRQLAHDTRALFGLVEDRD